MFVYVQYTSYVRVRVYQRTLAREECMYVVPRRARTRSPQLPADLLETCSR